GGRSAADRAALRRAMGRLRMAELRDGVWLRPDNLPMDDDRTESRSVVAPFTRWFRVHPDDDADLATRQWDLPSRGEHAVDLRREMARLLERLDAGDVDAVAPAFVLSAAVLRHFNADPLLPRRLLSSEERREGGVSC